MKIEERLKLEIASTDKFGRKWIENDAALDALKKEDDAVVPAGGVELVRNAVAPDRSISPI